MSAQSKVTKGIYTRKYQAKNIWEVGGACVEKQRKIRTTHRLCEFWRCCASVVRVSHKLRTTKVLCECCASFAQGSHNWRCCASFAQGSHNLKVLCEFRTSLEQLSSEGHIFFISAPNRTRFKALDSWLPELWNGIYHIENRLQEVLQKCKRRL